MYVNKFFRTTINQSGSTVIDQNMSILSIASKEDALLQYAKDNHITYLVLYDVRNIFGNSTYEGYLCSFIQKAETQYCIEKIGIAGSCAGLFDNVAIMAPTPPYTFSSPGNSLLQNPLAFVQNVYQPGDPLFYSAETIKTFLLATDFNDNCAYKIDVFVTEYEFWNSGTDECTGESGLSADAKYDRYKTLVTDMDVIRDNYNSSHTPHQVFTEAYTGYFHQNTLYNFTDIATWLDGTYGANLHRLDRINLHYYNTNGTNTFHWNNLGYYTDRFLALCSLATAPAKTYIHPIMSSEYIPWGAGTNYLGYWFNQNIQNNIFTAEKHWYDDWIADNGLNVHDLTYGNVVHPGGVQWFTSDQMQGHLDNPIMFTSNSPVCVQGGQNGTFDFQYQGPIEQGLNYYFYITDAGSSNIRCGTTNPIAWTAYSGTPLDLNAALSGCTLPAGDYDAHLILEFSTCNTCTIPPVRVSIINSASIVALTPTTVCQGNPVYLQANSSGGGTTTYLWYRGSTVISTATSSTFAPDPANTGTNTYYCEITSSVSGCSLSHLTGGIPVTINTYPAAAITPQSYNGCQVTLLANPTGMNYVWGDGTNGSTFTTSTSGIYSLNVTSNGCTRTTTYDYEKVHISLIPANPVTITCFGQNTGTIPVNLYDGVAPYSLLWYIPPYPPGTCVGNASGLTSGNYTISNLCTGTFTIIVTDANGCPRTLSSTPTVPTNPQITASTSSTPATCPNSTNGTATVSNPAGGDGGPYTYHWHFNNSTSATITGLAPGSYDVDIIDAEPCTTTVTVTVVAANPTVTPSISITPTNAITICQGQSYVLSSTITNGGTSPTYQWKDNTVNIASATNATFNISSLSVGTHNITVQLTSNALCATSSQVISTNTISVTVNANPTVTTSTTATSFCQGENATLTALPNPNTGITYQWQLNTNNISGATNDTYTVTQAGNYTIVITITTTQCSVTSTAINITVNPLPTPPILSNSGTSTLCVGGSATLTSSGSYTTYQWQMNGTDIGAATSSSYSAQYDVDPPNPDDYTLIVTNSFGCEATSSNTISVASDPNCCSIAGLTLPNFGFVTTSKDLGPTDITVIAAGTLDISGATTIISIGEARKIIVPVGTTLNIHDGATLKSCGNMWKGIEVYGTINISSNAVIRDAEFAVQLHDGATFNGEQAHFLDNYVSIYTGDGGSVVNLPNFRLVSSEFGGSGALVSPYNGQLTSLGSYPYSGILFNDVAFAAIGKYGYTAFNTFRDMNCGIIDHRSNLTVYLNKFRNILPDFTYTDNFNGSGIYGEGVGGSYLLYVRGMGMATSPLSIRNCFDNCLYGVYTNDISTSVVATSMTNMSKGIYIEAFSQATFNNILTQSNYIDCNEFGIHLINTEYAYYTLIQSNRIDVGNHILNGRFNRGIWIEEMSIPNPDSYIEGNNITLYNDGDAGIDLLGAFNYEVGNNNIYLANLATNQFGIRTIWDRKVYLHCNNILPLNSSATISTVNPDQSAIRIEQCSPMATACNVVDRTYNGFYVSGPSIFSLRGNQIMQHIYGLHLDAAATTGDQDHTGTFWTNNLYTKAAINENTSLADVFYVNNAAAGPPFFFAPSISDVSTGHIAWFVGATATPNQTCLLDDPINTECKPALHQVDPDHGGGDAQLKQIDLDISNDDIEFSIYDEGNKKTLKRYLYQKIKDNPGLVTQNSDIAAFADSTDSTSLAGLVDLRYSLEGIPGLQQTISNNIRANRAIIDQDNETIFRNDSAIQNDSTPTPVRDSLTLVNSNLKAVIISLSAYNRSAIQTLQSDILQELTNIQAENGYIVSPSQYEANEKTVNEIYLATVARGILHFTSAQINSLYDIATQCPMLGGPGVYLARTLYSYLDEYMIYDDRNICLEQGYILRKAKDEVATANYFLPNPASEKATLVYALSENNKAEIRIFNTIGEKVISQTLNPKNHQIDFSLSHFNQGIYFYQIYSNDEMISSGKLSIVR